ncbi:ABC transporter G family member 20-like isoform X1 [Macrobrachium rosenbergii]|uniref:ABC transporter G family member 20-like isoform X1 n=2 Tax=Macrobrachium rosenbergii TaxID=79674 RepID=UPI0034D4CC20
MASLKLLSYRPKVGSEGMEFVVSSDSPLSTRSSLYDSVVVDVKGRAPDAESKTSQISSDISLTRLDRKMDYTSPDSAVEAQPSPGNGALPLQDVQTPNKSVNGSANVVVVQQAFKSYGSGRHRVHVLEGLDMCVPQGAIYGLLGPSGCGKTTLLGCIVNRLSLDSGEIFLYGYPPGSALAAVPGHRVGYMPQELALYSEFTIGETLSYFGRIHNLSSEKIQERTNFLVKFLDLPEPNRLITQLSGGQQRRASFAAALVHEPELLILDEPTVGVDPLLRSSIWQHLLDICKTGRTTIIITTHYIEEARQADKVGLMRGGRLLAETSPSSLIKHFNIPSLEDIFLKLCLQDSSADDLKGSVNPAYDGDLAVAVTQSNTPGTLPKARGVTSALWADVNKVTGHTMLRDSEHTDVCMSPWIATSKYERLFSLGRFKALLIKNFIRLWRNLGFLIFSFLMPPLQTALFCLTVGGTPYDLNMAVVNLDPGIPVPPFLPTNISFSNDYLHKLNHHTLNLVNYSSFDEGHQSVVDGKSWGLIHFHKNFTLDLICIYGPENLTTYFCDPKNVTEDSKVHVYLDNTNSQIAITIWLEIFQSMEKFIFEIADTIEKITKTDFSKFALPLQVHDPIYGSNSATFTEFMAPGVILSITYFMAVGLTALSFVIERKEGLLDRSWVAGVQSSEVMLAFLATQMVVMLVQIALILVFMFLVFEIPCKGNMAWVILISILQGLCGMTFGLMTSALSKDENTALIMALGIFYPLLLLSGIVWPVEGMPTALRYIAIVLPQTYACDAIRAVLYRGWDITYSTVYLGYIITLVWLLIHVGITLIAVKVRK